MVRGTPVFVAAVRSYRAIRAEYQLLINAAYDRAEEACRGALLNARGRDRGIDAESLFMGTEARAHCYASEELIEHWLSYPRVTYRAFEAMWIEGDR